MRNFLFRFSAIVLLILIYFLNNRLFQNFRNNQISEAIIRFELPMPDDILEKYDLTNDFSIEKVIIAGYFSEWNPNDTAFEMTQVDRDTYQIELLLEPGDNQYKFVVYLSNRIEPVWVHNVNAKHFVDDNFGGVNSIVRIRDWDRIKQLIDIVLLGLMGILIIFTLLKPVVEWIMRMRMSIKSKLVLIVCIIGVFTNLIFIGYNFHEKRSLIKEGLIESMNLIHNFLLGQDADFSELNNQPNTETWESNINRFFDTAEARNERYKASNRQIVISKLLIFNTNFDIVAMGDREESIDIPDYTNRQYFRDVMFSPAIETLQETPELTRRSYFFRSGDYRLYYERYERLSKLIGFDAALHPIQVQNRLVGYYGISIHSVLYGNMLSDVLKFNFFLIIISAILLLLLMSNIGKLFIRNLDILYQWTNKTVNGDFSTEIRIDSHDEIEALSLNFNKMRISLDKYLHELKIMNTLTGTLSGITRIEELYHILLIFLTADFGFKYNRAAVFLMNDDHLKGMYSIGMLNEEEMIERFGSYHNYASFKLDIKNIIRDYQKQVDQNDTQFDEMVKTISIPLDSESVFTDTVRDNNILIVKKNQFPHTEIDEDIMMKLNLEEFILLPIIKDQQVIGILLLDSYFHKQKIDEKDKELIHIFTILINDFAVNLENVSLIEGLENMVGERTEQLREANDKLPIERDKLKTRNNAMENDLSLARTIQSMFIPAVSPCDNISYIYKPMEKVGGDFIDFYALDDGKIGVFISDVSGHGVSAAFITSIMKSFSLQNKELLNEPDTFLIKLNEFMMTIVPEKLVTAMFGIYDPAKHSFRFCNAGHPPPYLINDSGLALVHLDNKGFPLAMLKPNEIKDMKVRYSAQNLNLEKGDRLFFYTDGLWEAINVHADLSKPRSSIPDYGSTRLHDVLFENRHLSPQELVDTLMDDLILFRESRRFDDDICIVCIDYE